MKEHFKKQAEQGAAKMFFYAIENADQTRMAIRTHKGTLDSFPNLEYIRNLSEGIPLFKEPQ